MKTLVITCGTFRAFLHLGHLQYLYEACQLGDKLIILMDSEKRIREIKGSNIFVLPDAERLEMMSYNSWIDQTRLFNSDIEKEDLITKIWKNHKKSGYKRLVFVKGSDYNPGEVKERDLIKKLGGTVVTLHYDSRYSTTRILENIKNPRQYVAEPPPRKITYSTVNNLFPPIEEKLDRNKFIKE